MNDGIKVSGQGGPGVVVIPPDDFFFRLGLGEIEGVSGVNIVGRNTDVDKDDTPEDIWDGGAEATDITIWLPPTAARIHDIASSDSDDDGAPPGTGARTIRVFGLVDWDTPEVFEDLTLNGTTDVPTANSYVMINRMECLTFGSGGTNAGRIQATADVDGTVTAQIEPGFGGTMQGIYGFCSREQLQITDFFTNWNKLEATSGNADITMLIDRRPNEVDGGFVQHQKLGMFGSGNTYANRPMKPYFVVPGPALIKLQVEDTSEDNVDIVAGFDAILIIDR